METGRMTITEEPIEVVAARLFKKTWIISDGKIGDLIQCRGVAHALGVDAVERLVSPGKPWIWLMPWGPMPPQDRPDRPGSPLAGELPDLVIASGRRTLPYVRAMKRQAGRKLFSVFLKNPRASHDFLDLVWVPAHDNVEGPGVIATLSGPHRYSPRVIREMRQEKPAFLANVQGLVVAVFLGGESKVHSFTLEDCERLSKALRQISATGAFLAITPSRRSSELLRNTVRNRIADLPHFWWDESGENPYGALLAHADLFVATADSANMLTEACVTGRPIYVFKPTGGSKKFDRLLTLLCAYGATRIMPEKIEHLESWSYQPLYASDEIATAIVERAAKR